MAFEHYSKEQRHQPVMVQEVLEALKPKPNGQFIDATLGDGGHAEAILERTGPLGRLLGIERDPDMVRRASQYLARFESRIEIMRENFSELEAIAKGKKFSQCDGILFDLGVASWHFTASLRGLSFQTDAPLDMRFDPSASNMTAADIVNHAAPRELTRILKEFGEEEEARRITDAIVRHRPIPSTRVLAEIIMRTKRRKIFSRHPATKTFQALRIAVNNELDAFSVALPQAVALLRIGGILGIIAYHSLEDRIAKKFFFSGAREGSLELLFRKPLHAGVQEVRQNPRSRSAKFRAARRLI